MRVQGLKIVLLAGILSGALCALETAADEGEVVPVVSIITRKVYRLSPHGSNVESTRVGIYLRRSDGSAFERTIPQSGAPPEGNDEAWLWLAREAKLYRLDYQARRAVRMPMPADPLRFPYSAPALPGSGSADERIGRKVVAGLDCEGYRRPPEGNTREALYWLAPALNSLPLLSRSPGGEGRERVVRLEDVEVGREPDASFFELPEGFEVIE
jgi:hypothetical protein